MLGQLGHRLLDVHRVAGVDDGQPGDAAEDRHVLGRLMRRAVPGCQAGRPPTMLTFRSGSAMSRQMKS